MIGFKCHRTQKSDAMIISQNTNDMKHDERDKTKGNKLTKQSQLKSTAIAGVNLVVKTAKRKISPLKKDAKKMKLALTDTTYTDPLAKSAKSIKTAKLTSYFRLEQPTSSDEKIPEVIQL